jgi:hypothetical protein
VDVSLERFDPTAQRVYLVLPSVTSLSVPHEFLEPRTGYELEVLALEISGNQTISVLFFQTQ